MSKSWKVLLILMNATRTGWGAILLKKFRSIPTSAPICQYSSLWISWQAAWCKPPDHRANPSLVWDLIHLSLASSFISISSTWNMKPWSWRQGTERKKYSSGKMLKCSVNAACLEITQGTTQLSCLSLTYQKEAGFFFFLPKPHFYKTNKI